MSSGTPLKTLSASARLKARIADLNSAPDDRSRLRGLSRQLAVGLRKGTLDNPRPYLRELARVDTKPESFAHGYLEALSDLLAVHEVVSAQAAAVRNAADRINRNERWGSILRAIRSGVHSASELAEELGRDRSVLSRVLRTMREAGLVDFYPAPDDRRFRLYHLTGLGEHACEQANLENGTELEQGIELGLALCTRLVSQQRVSQVELQKLSAGPGGRRAVALAKRLSDKAVLHQLAQSGIGGLRSLVHHDDRCWLEPVLWRDNARLQAHLKPHLRNERVLVRIRRDEDESAWTKFLLTNFHGKARTLKDVDIELGLHHGIEDRALLYTSPRDVAYDRASEYAVALGQARRTLCIVGAGEPAPERTVPVEVSVPVEVYR